MRSGVSTRRKTYASVTAETDVMASQEDGEGNTPSSKDAACAMVGQEGEPSLTTILKVLTDFRHDNKQQLSEIKQELSKTNRRMDEAESRIEEAESVLQAATTLLNRVLQRQEELDARILEENARARRQNIRVFCISENSESNDMTAFLETLWKSTLDFPSDTDFGLEGCHRALTAKPSDPNAKPRSIVARFASYRMKEEVIRRAWGKKEVFYNGTRYFVDHDYPPAILKKRAEYAGAKKALQKEKIKFHSPYPAKLKVFYSSGTKVYQTAAEATADMASLGFQVDIIPPTTNPDQRELDRLSTWKLAEKRRGGASPSSSTGKKKQPTGVEKLQGFRRDSPPPTTD